MLQKIKVFIIEDHPIYLHGITTLIDNTSDMEVFGTANGVHEALTNFTPSVESVLILDLSLPDGSGLELCKQIRSKLATQKILVLTVYDESLYAERVRKAGASGFINKREPIETLLRGIREVYHHNVLVRDKHPERKVGNSIKSKHTKFTNGAANLSDRELEILRLIGEGLSSSEISSKLHLSSKTVQSYRDRLRKKLDLKNGSKLVQYAVFWFSRNL